MPTSPEALPTLWRIPDELWAVLRQLLDQLDPPSRLGRPRIDPRAALDAIVYRARTGCQWNHMPKEFPDDSSVHRTMQRWVGLDIFGELWGVLVESADDLKEVKWQWQSADGVMGKARHGGDAVGPNPTDRAKNGTKRSVLVEEDGGPLAVVLDGANRHDTKMLRATLEAVIVKRPTAEEQEQHLLLDKGYDNPTGRATVAETDYQAHIRPIGEEKSPPKKHGGKPRRWVVERTIGWMNRWRGVLVRYEKKAENYLAMVKLACALLWFRRLWDVHAF